MKINVMYMYRCMPHFPLTLNKHCIFSPGFLGITPQTAVQIQFLLVQEPFYVFSFQNIIFACFTFPTCVLHTFSSSYMHLN